MVTRAGGPAGKPGRPAASGPVAAIPKATRSRRYQRPLDRGDTKGHAIAAIPETTGSGRRDRARRRVRFGSLAMRQPTLWCAETDSGRRRRRRCRRTPPSSTRNVAAAPQCTRHGSVAVYRARVVRIANRANREAPKGGDSLRIVRRSIKSQIARIVI